MKNILILVCLSVTVIASAQNVGIGIENPTRAKLEVHGVAGNGATSAIFGGEGSGVSFQRGLSAIGYNQYQDATGGRYMFNGYAAVQSLNPANGRMSFDMIGAGSTNGLTGVATRALSFSSLGQVSVGSSFYNSSLSISRNPGVQATAMFQGTTHLSAFNYGQQENTYIRAGKDGGTVFINDIPGGKIAISGNVGINRSNPQYPLEVEKIDDMHMILIEANVFNNWEWNVHSTTGDLQLIFNGSLRGKFVKSSGDYQRVSDGRLKTHITGLPSVLDKVMKLQPVEYEVINNNPKHRRTIGFIAQDVRELFPELVIVNGDTTGNRNIKDLHTLNYDGFGVLAIRTIQEQQELIKSQSEAIEALRNRIAGIKKSMQEL